ncbi:MAG TPA: hypothetical protein VID50_10965, partial [Candidatus Eisenbacteria bacterium]
RLGALALLIAFLPAAGRAAEPGDPFKVRVNLAFFAGLQRYSMSDVNEGIDQLNAAFQSNPILAASGLRLHSFHGGAGIGAGIRVWPRERILIAADYQHLTGKSSSTVPVSSQPGAPSFKAKAAVPAQAIELTAGYFFYRPWTALRVGVGAGAAYYICDGRYEFAAPGAHAKTELHGTGVGFHGLVLGDLHVSDTIQFEAAVGYRRAKTTDLEDRGVKLILVDGSKARADYSGLITRVGIDIPFGPVK